MSTIGSLAVNVVADTSGLSKGLSKGRSELGLFGKAGEFADHNLKGLLRTLAGLYSLHAIGEKIMGAAENLIHLGHTAETLNVTTQALGGLEHAAAMNHISTETLTKSLTYMEKNLIKNSSEVEKLGLNIYALQQMKADQIFLNIAGAIAKLPKGPEQIAAVTSIFGKGATVGGAGILKLIQNGPAEIRAAMDEAATMGLAPTKDEIAELEKLDEAILRIKEHSKGMWQRIAIAAAPSIEKLLDSASFASATWNQTPGYGGDDIHRGAENKSAYQRLVDSMNGKDFGSLAGKIGGASGKAEIADALKQSGFHVDSVIEFNHIMEAITARLKVMDQQLKEKIHPPDLTKLAGSGLQTAWDNLRSMGSYFLQKPTGDANDLFTLKGAYEVGGEAHPEVGFGTTPAEEKRLANLVDQMERPWLAPREAPRRTVGGGGLNGFSALESGTVEAFRQERRSTLAADPVVTIQKDHLQEAKKQSAQLGRIDQNTKKQQQMEIINIA